jgi:hypothetical protein
MKDIPSSRALQDIVQEPQAPNMCCEKGLEFILQPFFGYGKMDF